VLLLLACSSPPVDALAPGTSWQWQLSGTIDTSLDVQMYDVDLFDASDAALEELSSRYLVCYFSAGTWEDWRDDADSFPTESIGAAMEDWEGESWFDIRDSGVRSALEARLNFAVERGCDGVEPDNVDGYANDSGFDLSADDQLDFNRFLAEAAHARGLSVGLKNDLDQVRDLVDDFDWALNEECVAYDECGVLAAFTDAGKAAFHVEYVDAWADAEALADEVCDVGPDLDTLVKTWDLDERRLGCDER
jgi:hypothetical protein